MSKINALIIDKKYDKLLEKRKVQKIRKAAIICLIKSSKVKPPNFNQLSAAQSVVEQQDLLKSRQGLVPIMVKAMGSPESRGLVARKEQAVSSKGKVFWKIVWRRLEELGEKGKALWGTMSEWFDVANTTEMNQIIEDEYRKNQVKERKNVKMKEWQSHFYEYWGDKDKWDGAFKRKPRKKFSLSGLLRKKRSDVGKKQAKTVPGIKYNMGVMRLLTELYKDVKDRFDVPGREKGLKLYGEAGEDAPLLTKGVDKEQPYSNIVGQEKDIILGRSDLQKLATKDNMGKLITKGILLNHQKDFVNLAMENFKNGHKSTFNFDGTGCGKTMQQLALAQSYIEQSNKPVLITTESKGIYDDAFLKDAKLLGIPITWVTDESEISGPGIFVTDYNKLNKIAPVADKIGLALFDESHNMKNATARTGAKSAKAKFGIELINKVDNVAFFTATPIDKPGHVKYMTEALGLDYKKTMKYLEYNTKKVKDKRTGKWKDKSYRIKDEHEQGAKMEAFFNEIIDRGHGAKREVSLDHVSIEGVNVKMSEKQKIRYMKAERKVEKIRSETKKAKATGKNVAQALLALRQINEEIKVDWVVEQAKAAIAKGEQIVIFTTSINDTGAEGILETPSKGVLLEIERRLNAVGIPSGTIYGRTKKEAEKGETESEKQRKIDDFQKGNIKVLITTPKSGGTGINLDDQIGDTPRTAIIMTPPFSAMEVIQMMGRINRMKTKSDSKVLFPVTETSVDTWNMNIIARKLATLGGAVGGDYAKVDIAKSGLSGDKRVKASPYAWEEYLQLHEVPEDLIEAHPNEIKKAFQKIGKGGLFIMAKAIKIKPEHEKYFENDPEDDPNELRFAEEVFLKHLESGAFKDGKFPDAYPGILHDM